MPLALTAARVPPWNTVYYYFRHWRSTGTWHQLHTALREQSGRRPQPSASTLDSQSIKTTGVGGSRGYDGGKKISGHKRHLLVDTEGLVLRATVHTAEVQDRAGVPLALTHANEEYPAVQEIWVDQGYTRTGQAWIADQLGWRVEVVQRVGPRRWMVQANGTIAKVLVPRGFAVLPRRWVVERTRSWLGQNQRLSKDDERTCATRDAGILIALIRLMVRRVA